MIADQAETLRAVMAAGRRSSGRPRIIAVTSGKGGVGKTTLTINLAVAWARAGKRVIVFDADLGLANVDVMLGLQSRYNLADVVSGGRQLREILVTTHAGVQVVPGASGVPAMADLPDPQRRRLIEALASLEESADVIVIDTAAGIGASVSSFVLAAPEVVVVTTPEPTAITDAYALIKVVHQSNPAISLKLVVNQAASHREADEAMRKLTRVTAQFLGARLEDCGYLPVDSCVPQSIRRQVPALIAFPRATVSARICSLSQRLWLGGPAFEATTGMIGFLQRLVPRRVTASS